MTSAIDDFAKEAERVEKDRQEAVRKADRERLTKINDALMLAERDRLLGLVREGELTQRERGQLDADDKTDAAGRGGGFELRHLLNGLVDGYLYDSGRIDTTLPFDELRRRSLINEAARAAEGAPDFSQRIRASLPTMPHQGIR